MFSYTEYKTFGGKLSEEDFTSLFPKAYDFIQSFVDKFVASWKLKESLEDYGEFDKALTYQIDFISDVGGIASFNGQSDLNIKEVSTGNFKYSQESSVEMYNGVPLSPLAKSLIMKELRKNGYLSRCLND